MTRRVVAPHLLSHEQEIARVNVRHHCVVQHDAIVAVVGDDDIAIDLLHMLLHGCEVSEDRVIDLQMVLTGGEVRDGIVAKVDRSVGAGKDEGIVAETAGQRVVAAVAVQDIVIVIADERVGIVGAVDVLDINDRAFGPPLVMERVVVGDDMVRYFPAR